MSWLFLHLLSPPPTLHPQPLTPHYTNHVIVLSNARLVLALAGSHENFKKKLFFKNSIAPFYLRFCFRHQLSKAKFWLAIFFFKKKNNQVSTALGQENLFLCACVCFRVFLTVTQVTIKSESLSLLPWCTWSSRFPSACHEAHRVFWRYRRLCEMFFFKHLSSPPHFCATECLAP